MAIAALGLAITVLAVMVPTGADLALYLGCTALAPLALLPLRWSALGLLAASISLALPLWGCYTLAAWAMGLPARLLQWMPAAGSALAVTALALAGPRTRLITRPRWTVTALAVALGLLVAIPTLAIQRANGPRHSPGGDWVFDGRHWVSLDSFYLFALAQQAHDRQHYPDENPFYSGAPNRYPALLHTGLAGLTAARARDAWQIVALHLWGWYPLILVAGVVCGFYALMRAAPRSARRRPGWLAAGYGAFILLRADHFIYPHTQALAFPLLAVALHAVPVRRRAGPAAWIPFTLLGLMLVASHTVTATVALTLAGAMAATALVKRTPIAGPAAAATLLLAAFAWMNLGPGQPLLQTEVSPEYKKLAALALVAPYAVPLVITLYLAWRNRRRAAGLAAAALVAATLAWWARGFTADSFNAATFAIYNAPRFALFALLLSLWGLPISRGPAVALSALVLYALLMPTVAVRQIPLLITAEPQRMRLIEAGRLREELRGSNGAIITNIPGFIIPTLTGRPLYYAEGSYYGFALGTVPEQDSLDRAAAQHRFFQEMDDAARRQFLEAQGLTAITSPTMAIRPP